MLFSTGTKQDVLQGLDETLLNIAKIKHAVSEFVPKLPGWARLWVTETDLHIDIPYDWQMYKEVRRLLGPEFQSEEMYTAENGNMWRHLRHESGIKTFIILDPNKAESTCDLVQVGEKTVPIFEARCH